MVVRNDEGSPSDKTWELVPGEIVEEHRPRFLEKARGTRHRQREERGYYLPCSRCERLIHQVMLEGCERRDCSAPPTEVQVAQARARHDEALVLIDAERERIAASEDETEDEGLGEVLDAASAVDRLIGLSVLVEPSAGADVQLAAEPPASSLADGARAALRAAAEASGDFEAGYCAHAHDNLVDSLTLGQARQALSRLSHGAGSELLPHGDTPPKFLAAHSSSALAVNAFAAWIGREPWLQLVGRGGFDRIEFEVQFPTGLAGKPPHLDVVVSGPAGLVAIESKCTEHLAVHVTEFQPSYQALIAEIAEAPWHQLFAELQAGTASFRWVDVGQLVRHYLGLRRAVLHGCRVLGLLYLYWEPADATEHLALREHTEEAQRLAELSSGTSVPVTCMSYPDLWDTWSASGAPSWLLEHVAALRRRYNVRCT